MLTTNNLLKIAIEASLKAGEAIMSIYDKAFTVDYKDDQSPLTEADLQANAIINAHLVKTEIPIISEENKQLDYSLRKNWTNCWVVDPVDGTKEFIKRNGEFTVNIALVQNGKPLYGVIYAPAYKSIYFADVQKKQAFKANLRSLNSPLEVLYELSEPISPKLNKENVVQVVGSRSHMNSDTLNFVDSLKSQGFLVETVSKGSSLKFCLVAEGKADIYPRFAPTWEWDTAAGQAICNAVGIDVISEDTKLPLVYNKENLLNPSFLVAPKE